MKYRNYLLTLEEKHPEIFREYQDGIVSINRTTKHFSGNLINLTLEKTINANAASQRIPFLETIIISYLNEDLNLTKKERHYQKSESFKQKSESFKHKKR